MTVRLLFVVILLTVLCRPLWAWRGAGDEAVLKQQYVAFADQAMTQADKCLAAEKPEISRARYLLLAIADLCVPAGGNSPKVPEATITAYKALWPKAWAADVPDEAAFTAMLKATDEQLNKAYVDAFYIADNADTYQVKTVAAAFAKAQSQYPDALALCLEIAGKSIPPEAFTKYFYQGDAGSVAVRAQRLMSNVFAGPETIQAMCKETFVPNALEAGKQELANAANTKDPDQMKMYAKWAQEYVDFILWADPENAGGKELGTQAQALRDKAKAIYEAQIKANRVPPNRYTGEDAAALREGMKKVFMFEIPHTILRVVITSPQWEEKPHVWTGYNAVDVGWYKLIDGAVVIKRTGDGTCWVHPVTFGRRWLGKGDNYGDLVVYGWADNYQILPEWAMK